jgi:hypothetical protein
MRDKVVATLFGLFVCFAVVVGIATIFEVVTYKEPEHSLILPPLDTFSVMTFSGIDGVDLAVQYQVGSASFITRGTEVEGEITIEVRRKFALNEAVSPWYLDLDPDKSPQRWERDAYMDLLRNFETQYKAFIYEANPWVTKVSFPRG